MYRVILPILILAVPLEASAQLQANSIQNFYPTPGGHGFFSREYGEVGLHLEPYAAIWVDYANAPLVRLTYDQNGKLLSRTEVVSHQLQMDVVGALALWDILEIGVGIPFIPYQAGPGLPASAVGAAQAVSSAAFGDLRLQPKVSFFNTENVHLGAAVMITFPTGNENAFAGEQTVTGTPKLMANFTFVERRLNFGVDLGARFRGEAHIGDVTTGHDFQWGAHLSYQLIKNILTAGLEAYGNARFGVKNIGEAPAEGLLGFKANLGPIQLSLGGGTGFNEGVGAPRFRIVGGIAFFPRLEKERPPLEPEPPASIPASIPVPEPEPIPAPPPPPPPPPKVVPLVEITRERIAISDKIYFEFDSDAINPVSFPLLDKVAEVLIKNPRLRRIRVEGHTDNVGSDAYNMDLSSRRSRSVMMYLIKHQVENKRLTYKGFGFRKPKTSNATARGRAINRRVEFIIELQEIDPSEVVPTKASFDEDVVGEEPTPVAPPPKAKARGPVKIKK